MFFENFVKFGVAVFISFDRRPKGRLTQSKSLRLEFH